ncbi:Ubiquitin carboxyl-terminal hydrolase [Giardia muris]|uniref:Ubiquitin carboxyl-terminal hydrolase n=1 Tax=Giardia muris TaxID=5742 RepID=A0A4Z1T8C7_GIAMU|nr:Ubiquitin carboxyl-terminal hydrolase [Giardia muris]|eukprot:TNJ29387.1 Ubiquitin carboxyl-terminal hydrolase [Giardia muris]
MSPHNVLGASGTHSEAARRRLFSPRRLRFVEKSIPGDMVLGSGFYRKDVVSLKDVFTPSSINEHADMPRPGCYITDPDLVHEATTGGLSLPKSFCSLKNHGVTCYVNACIRALQGSIYASKLIYSSQYRHLLEKDQLSRAIFKLFDRLRNERCFHPEELIQQLPRFKMSRHAMGDSCELLILLLDKLSAAELAASKLTGLMPPDSDTTAIDQLFGQAQCTTISCCRCKSMSRSYAITRILHLHAASSLGAALRRHLKSTQIQDYTCKSCGPGASITMRQHICNTPRVVLFALSRWTLDGMKQNVPCSLPLQLDLSMGITEETVKALLEVEKRQKSARSSPVLPEPIKNATHNLVAVIRHHGLTQSSGHYTALLRSPHSHTWFMADDATITVSSSQEVTRGEDAYFVVYEHLSASLAPQNSGLECLAQGESPNVDDYRAEKKEVELKSGLIREDEASPEEDQTIPNAPCTSRPIRLSPPSLSNQTEVPEVWGELPAEVQAERLPGGKLSLTSPLLHAQPDDMDADIDRGRRRKTRKDHDANRQARQEKIDMRRKKKAQAWKEGHTMRFKRNHKGKHTYFRRKYDAD